MKTTFIFVLSLAFLLAFPPTGQAQALPDTLSLEQLMEYARQKALGGAEARADLEQARLSFRIYRAQLKPQFNAFANLPNYSKTFSEITQPDGTILFQPITNNNSAVGLSLRQEIPLTGGAIFLRSDLQRFDNFELNDHLYNGVPLRLGIIQPLFAFNQFKWDKKLEPIRWKEAQKKFAAQLEDINISTAELFFALLEAQQNLAIATSNTISNQSLYEIAKERYELGKISRRDLMQLELELISARKDQLRARQNGQQASIAIYDYLGMSSNGRPPLYLHVPKAEQAITVSSEVALRAAKNNRFELEQYRRELLEAQRDIAQTKGDGGLQANITASFGFVRSAKNPETIYRDPQQEQFAQLQVNIPIIDWGRQKARVEIQRVKQEFTQESIKRNALQFETAIRQQVQLFQNLQEELKLMEEVLRVAQEQFDIAKQSYILGAISITELSLSQGEKDRAMRDYIFTLSQYWLAYYELRSSTLYDFISNRSVRKN